MVWVCGKSLSILVFRYDYTYHNFFCQDGLTWEESQIGNWLKPVFKDGKLLRIYTLDEVRKNLHEGNF